MSDMPKFHNMQIHAIAQWCVDNNNDLFDASEWPDIGDMYHADFTDENEQEMQQEYESIAEEIYWKNLKLGIAIRNRFM